MTANSGSKSDSIHVRLEVKTAGGLQRLLSMIGNSSIAVHVESVTATALSGDETVECDLGSLTDKQRQTLELALRSGYYERPREIDLTELAARLDISKSAVSQRLRAAEHKLIKQTFGHHNRDENSP
jgi:predicted DNA binding protein